MQFVNPDQSDLTLFLDAHSPQDDELLAELVRETYRCTEHPRMLGGAMLGAFLQMCIRMLRATHVLELGTFTGYTTIQMARTRGDLRVTTVEKEPEHARIAQRFFAQANVQDRVTLVERDALEWATMQKESYQLIFMDSDKRDYPRLFDLLADRITPGGLLIADNVLWHGKVLNPEAVDAHTQAVRQFNEQVNDDPRFVSCVLPARDGLLIAQRLED